MMVMYKNYMGCKTRYIRRVNVIKTINGNVYPLVLFLMKFLRAVKNTNGLLLFKCNMLHDDVLLQNCTCENTNTASQVLLYIVNIEKMKNNIVLEISFEWFTMSSWRVFHEQINNSVLKYSGRFSSFILITSGITWSAR